MILPVSVNLDGREESAMKVSVPYHLISNSNWTKRSTIQGVIGRVISKSAERELQGRFEITSTITP